MLKLTATLLLLSSPFLSVEAAPAPNPCNTVIIGGGIGGLYSAVNLQSATNTVCVFEKYNRLGGRIDDVQLDSGIEVVGLGAWRFDDNHSQVKSLATHYQIPFTPWNRIPKFVGSRGIVANSTSELLDKAFPEVKAQFGEKDFLSEMMNDVKTDLQSFALPTPDMQSYILKKYNKATHEYLLATNGGFTGDFYTPDAASYLGEFLPAEFTDSGNQNRPKGGMSEFIRRLEADAKAKGVKIFLGEGVTVVDKARTGGYVVRTTKRIVVPSKLVINAPPLALKAITGSAITPITSSAQFNSILPTPAFKSASYFSTAFWEGLLAPLEQFIPGSTCLGQILPYVGKGVNGEAILHTAYSDGPCTESTWRKLSGSKITEGQVWGVVGPQVQTAFKEAGLATTQQPKKTVWQFWEAAWHWQKAGSGVSLAAVQNWASNPVPGEAIYLTNEAYGVRRTWAQAALETARNGLQKFGVIPAF